ncbi:MAG: c-type cytochrome [Planctomycetota bacterium]
MSTPNTPKQPDPILTSSLSWPLAIVSLLLMASTLWAMYDEIWGLRPWKNYQAEYIQVYGSFLDGIKKGRAEALTAVTSTDKYKALEQERNADDAKIKDQVAAIQKQLDDVVQPQIEVMTKAMIDPRSQVTAKIYDIESADAPDKPAQEALLKEIESTPIPVDLPTGPGKVEKKNFKYEELSDALSAAKAMKGTLSGEMAKLQEPGKELQAQMDAMVALDDPGLTPDKVAALKNNLDSFDIEIKQIHVKDIDLVDRCESCHVGERSPANMPVDKLLPIVNKLFGPGHEDLAHVFASHPKAQDELLKIHDPEKFGCSPCHGGNGVGTTSVDYGHGKYEHWLWPLYDNENTEAGCVQCHDSELKLKYGQTISDGKELFRHLGCWGCHSRSGFNQQKGEVQTVEQELTKIADARKELVHQQELNNQTRQNLPDDAPDSEKRGLIEANVQITLQISNMAAKEQALKAHEIGLFREWKKVAPDLKNARAKLNRDWIPVWISGTRQFRPDTKMPQFQLTPEQTLEIAAFIWQSGDKTKAPAQAPGDATLGKRLFHARGCLACHSIGEGDDRIGGSFAPNLSREGEKANYDFLVHWIQHPDKRLVPYNHVLGRDYTPEETAALEKSDPDHNDQAWEQATIMPNLRLTTEESRDIASYLMTQKHSDVDYPKADKMDDPAVAEKGKAWVKLFGCAGCHEISGMENDTGIGTDLTQEGSKPIDRLDFGLMTQDAEMGRTFPNDPYASEFKDAKGNTVKYDWYTHKGFFERKLKSPEIWDQGKDKSPTEKLHMPNFGLNKTQISQLVTFLLGSVDISPELEKYQYTPTGAAKAIADGWWVVQKYNCVGCHQFVPGQNKPEVQNLPQFDPSQTFTDLDGTKQPGSIGFAPPNLVGEGARVNPQWLADFLRNPSLSTTDINGNGVRQYLKIRMPTFSLSEDEIQKLVRFFNALSNQSMPYVAPKYPPLTAEETTIARHAVAVGCVRCHASETMKVYPATVIAPNLGLAQERLKPSWIERWVVAPQAIFPGTNMPNGIFQYDDAQHRWLIGNQETPGMKTYPGDERDLIVRYLMQLDPAEAAKLKAESDKLSGGG